MSRNYFLFFKPYKILLFPLLTILVFSFNQAQSYSANELGGLNDVPPQGRDLYNTLPGENQKGGILDATNPLELMNRLRRATAMDDATSPSDAIDDALKELEEINFKAIE